MKYLTLFILMISNWAFAQCQNKPYFTLYFEDAKGQHDTLKVGISSQACDSSLNSTLGEFKISEVFADDLRFKVIGTKVKQDSTGDLYTYKAIFSKQNFFYRAPINGDLPTFQKCGSRNKMMIIKCRILDFPIKISIQSQLTPNDLEGFSFYFTSQFNTFSNTNGAKIAINRKEIVSNFSNTISLEKSDITPWPNSEKDFLLLFFVSSFVVSTNDLNSKNINSLEVFPNPSTNYLQFNSADLLDGLPVLLYNASGTLLAVKTVNHNEISTNDLPAGLITGVVHRKDKPIAVFRFLQLK